MLMRTKRVRVAALLAVGGLAMSVSLSACATAAPAADTCPADFVETVNAATLERGIDFDFSTASLTDVEPAELRSLVTGACILGFDGTIRGQHASGTFAFVAAVVEPGTVGALATALGYEFVNETWVKPVSATRAAVITQTTPNGNGSLLDLTDVFPAVTTVIASFDARN